MSSKQGGHAWMVGKELVRCGNVLRLVVANPPAQQHARVAGPPRCDLQVQEIEIEALSCEVEEREVELRAKRVAQAYR